MPIDVSASVRIEVPPSAVAAIEFDPSRDPEWIMRIDVLEPDRHVGMHALKSPFPMDVAD